MACQSEGGSTRLAVFTGDKLSKLVPLTSSADAPSNPALVTFAAEAGVAYQIAVLGGPGASEDFTVRFVQQRLRIVSPLNSSAHPEPASLQLAAAMDEGAQPARVEYYLGTQFVGDASSPPFAVWIRDLPAGAYALTGVGRFASGVTSISLPSSFLVYRDLAIPKPRIFSGPFGLASHVINALAEHRIFGRGGSGFGLRGPGEWSVPRMAQRPPGVEAWLSIQSGPNGESWALTPTGELFVNGEEAVTPPPGVGRWVALRTGPSGALLVGDDGRIYLEGRHPIEFALPGKHWTDIAAGQLYHCTLDDTGAAYMHTLDGSRPVTQAVPFPSDGVRRWVQMEGGVYVVLLKGDNGQLYEAKPFGPWGEYQATVTSVANPPGVVGWDGFAAGGFHAMAIGSDGQLYTWGRNSEGQLGIGGAGFDLPALQKVTPPPGVTAWSAVAAGYMHSLAVGNDCALYGWGRNIEGQLGIGPIPSPTVAGRVQNVGVLCAFPIVYQDALPTVLEDGSFRLRFTSDLNRLYLIQYSADAQTWRTAVTPVLGTGAFVEWTDAGPPETETPPASVPERFYRIVFAP